MLDNTNNYNNLTSQLSQLKNGEGDKLNKQATTGSNGSAFANSLNNTETNFMSSFSGFEQQLGQRYSMSGNQTLQLLQTFVSVLSELMGDVVNNSTRHNSPQSPSNDSQGNAAAASNGSTTVGGANTASADAAYAGESASSVSGSEAAQTEKTGGCPHTAAESE